jgi:hypothetical protein
MGSTGRAGSNGSRLGDPVDRGMRSGPHRLSGPVFPSTKNPGHRRGIALSSLSLASTLETS